MAYDATKWGSLFPATIGNEARSTDAIDNTLDFATNTFPQFMANDPVKYVLQNAFLQQLFSNDQRIKEITDNIEKGYLPLSGGTMTGALILSGAPTADLHAATKKYVDGLTTVMTGATANADGGAGEVPKPTKGQQNSVLTGAGTWQAVLSLLAAFTGATASADGALGGVPQPIKGQQNNILTGNGAWTGLADLLKALGMKYSFDNNGYINFGTVLGGFILQWGFGVTTNAKTTINFPIQFPNQCMEVIISDGGVGPIEWAAANLTDSGFLSTGGTSGGAYRYIAIGN
ncbi:hypothetical protein [Megasphaera cerevisiae]|uniref:gp53-like domain-containing protein n=1 Tax=Megasphaera cerevisiae TaxID=39029 RepID=UPI00065AF1AE|nr:hypothetical protein [Megasphaera cerevisiae]SKA01611.1 hypothetical protein SAMN05660900_02125 [Megasphaera cerevisiae DSM 20462]